MRNRFCIFGFSSSKLFLGSLLAIFVWFLVDTHQGTFYLPTPPREGVVKSLNDCKECSKDVKRAIKYYSVPWKKNEYNRKEFRSQMTAKGNAAETAIITKRNTPVGSRIIYSGENKSFNVSKHLFSTFPKESPLTYKSLETCSVVGNGGIMLDKNCGQQIDSAQFVIRCNLPPLTEKYEQHVGKKTDIVTANPSILQLRYHSLRRFRTPFMDHLNNYKDSILALPAFAFRGNTPLSLQAVYSLKDFGSPMCPVYFNPRYFRSLHAFWKSRGLKERRLSTGFAMVSLALDLCNSVTLYGFWPFSVDPYDLHYLTNHYYDDRKVKKAYHHMPGEFNQLLKLHRAGVLRIELGPCQ